MKNKLLLVFIAALFFASCSRTDDPLLLNNDGSQSEKLYKKDSEGKKEIKGSLTYYYTSDGENSCGEGLYSTGNYTGTGELSHLGKIVSTTVGCLRFLQNGVNVVEGQTTTFKMPNNDLIYLSNDSYNLYFIGDMIVGGEAKFYFNGGTGKYANAQGSFTCDVVNYLLEKKFTVDLKGHLKY